MEDDCGESVQYPSGFRVPALFLAYRGLEGDEGWCGRREEGGKRNVYR